MSQRHPASRRAQQDSNSEPDDVFVARVLHAGKWAERNQQILTVAMVVVAIAAAGLLYYRSYSRSLTQQAAQQLELIYQTVAMADTEGARTELGTFIERFGGTPYGPEARLLLGDLYLRDGSPQQAQAVLRPLGESPSEPIELQAAQLLAVAYEQDNQPQEAERLYLQIADRAELAFEVRDALAAAGRLRAERGDAAGALELYQRALDELEEDDPNRGLFEMRIEELRTATST
ncbi:MAG: tetratricopeptide repeat protein [Gemmatimonadetes bacterium]|nr:tetratricopeptide repeat protein [Gemmatimonadota bacterium]